MMALRLTSNMVAINIGVVLFLVAVCVTGGILVGWQLREWWTARRAHD